MQRVVCLGIAAEPEARATQRSRAAGADVPALDAQALRRLRLAPLEAAAGAGGASAASSSPKISSRSASVDFVSPEPWPGRGAPGSASCRAGAPSSAVFPPERAKSIGAVAKDAEIGAVEDVVDVVGRSRNSSARGSPGQNRHSPVETPAVPQTAQQRTSLRGRRSRNCSTATAVTSRVFYNGFGEESLDDNSSLALFIVIS